MYERLKKLIPKKFLKQNEKHLRALVSIFYKENKYQCNICNFRMSKFIELENKDRLCPKCASFSRTRRLWSVLENRVQAKKILHFSPSNSIKNKLEAIKNVEYITSDFAGEFDALKNLNIEAIDEPENCYDLIICYHILEHIQNDNLAMKELYRILRPQGICIIQTPFKTGEIYENDSVKTDEERLGHFGQKDHLRIYSPKGLMKRLNNAGFKTNVLEFQEKENNFYGYKIEEKIILAVKPDTFKSK